MSTRDCTALQGYQGQRFLGTVVVNIEIHDIYIYISYIVYIYYIYIMFVLLLYIYMIIYINIHKYIILSNVFCYICIYIYIRNVDDFDTFFQQHTTLRWPGKSC